MTTRYTPDQILILVRELRATADSLQLMASATGIDQALYYPDDAVTVRLFDMFVTHESDT